MKNSKENKWKYKKEGIKERPPEHHSYPRIYVEDGALSNYLILMYNSFYYMKFEAKQVATDSHTSGNKWQNASQNPLWYRNFCSNHETNRKRKRKRKIPDTIIKRKNIINALKTLIKNGYSQSLYRNELITIAENLKEEEIIINKGYEINRNKSELYDLEGIPRILNSKEKFNVAKIFKNNLEKKIKENPN